MWNGRSLARACIRCAAALTLRSPRSGDQDHFHRRDFYQNVYQNRYTGWICWTHEGALDV
jgi:hypothetical protein